MYVRSAEVAVPDPEGIGARALCPESFLARQTTRNDQSTTPHESKSQMEHEPGIAEGNFGTGFDHCFLDPLKIAIFRDKRAV